MTNIPGRIVPNLSSHGNCREFTTAPPAGREHAYTTTLEITQPRKVVPICSAHTRRLCIKHADALTEGTQPCAVLESSMQMRCLRTLLLSLYARHIRVSNRNRNSSVTLIKDDLVSEISSQECRPGRVHFVKKVNVNENLF